MAESRKRSGNHHFQKPSAIPSSQRTKGRILWSVLFAVFAFLIVFFALGRNYLALALALIIGAIIGYIVGKKMESNAKDI